MPTTDTSSLLDSLNKQIDDLTALHASMCKGMDNRGMADETDPPTKAGKVQFKYPSEVWNKLNPKTQAVILK